MTGYRLFTKSFTGLVLANMFFWMSTNFFLPVLPLYYHNLGLNDHQIGLAVGAFSLGSVSVRIFAGKVVDRYGSLLMISAGIVLSILAIASYSFSTSLLSAAISRFIHGIGISGYSAAALTMATFMHDEQHATEAVAAYTLFTMFGMGIATSSAIMIYQQTDFIWVIAAGIVATILSLVLFPKHPQLKIRPSVRESLPLKEIVRNPAVYVPTISLLAANICYGSVMTFLPLFMLSRGDNQFGMFYIAYALAIIVSRIWVGKLCNWLTAEKMACYLLVSFSFTMFVISVSTGAWALAIAGAGVGISYGLAFPTMATTITHHTQPANRGTAFGFFTMAVDVGFGIGAIGMGAVAAMWGYQAVFEVAGGYTLLYAVVYFSYLLKKVADPVTHKSERVFNQKRD